MNTCAIRRYLRNLLGALRDSSPSLILQFGYLPMSLVYIAERAIDSADVTSCPQMSFIYAAAFW